MAHTDTADTRTKRRRGARQSSAAKKQSASSVINLRADAATRALIDRAASALGQTRTEFMLATARSRATEVLLNQRLFVLNHSDWASLVSALDAPVPPNPKLKALLARKPIWDRQ
jgi:uncharacterized protein (DUF1778 family)